MRFILSNSIFQKLSFMVFSVALSASVFGELLAYESFDYTEEGKSFNEKSGGVGWQDSWASMGSTIASGSPLAPGARQSGGGKAKVDASSFDRRRLIDKIKNQIYISKDLWISFILSYESGAQATLKPISFAPLIGLGGDKFSIELTIDVSQNSGTFGFNELDQEFKLPSSQNAYLFVIHLYEKQNSQGSFVADLFVPTSSDSNTPIQPIAHAEGKGSAEAFEFQLLQGAKDYYYDEIRFGTTYEDVEKGVVASTPNISSQSVNRNPIQQEDPRSRVPDSQPYPLENAPPEQSLPMAPSQETQEEVPSVQTVPQEEPREIKCAPPKDYSEDVEEEINKFFNINIQELKKVLDDSDSSFSLNITPEPSENQESNLPNYEGKNAIDHPPYSEQSEPSNEESSSENSSE